MKPEFDYGDLFCRINVQTELAFEDFVACIARCAGGSRHMNAVRSQTLDISVSENDDHDTEMAHTGKDRWLHFRYTLEIDPPEGVLPRDYIAAIGTLLQSLWSSGMDAVAACDFEEELPRNVRRLTWASGPRSEGQDAAGADGDGLISVTETEAYDRRKREGRE
jgi:hypothetical protein